MSTSPFRPLIAACALASAVGLSGAASAEDMSNRTVMVSNTFTGALTKGVETDVGRFGMNNNLFATVGGDVEFPGFLGLYSVDLDGTGVAFSWVETDFSKSVAGPTPEGNFDRNYFVLDLPAGTVIKSVEYDAAGSKLIDGSALPTAEVISSNKFVTLFGAGVIRQAGFEPRFTVTLGAAD